MDQRIDEDVIQKMAHPANWIPLGGRKGMHPQSCHAQCKERSHLLSARKALVLKSRAPQMNQKRGENTKKQ
eukprot:scaffold23029_cov206-Cylindrotheca_fusiformis.AAC.2